MPNTSQAAPEGRLDDPDALIIASRVIQSPLTIGTGKHANDALNAPAAEGAWISSLWLFGPELADVLVGCEPLKGLPTLGGVVGVEEVGAVTSKPVVGVVVVSTDGGFFGLSPATLGRRLMS